MLSDYIGDTWKLIENTNQQLIRISQFYQIQTDVWFHIIEDKGHTEYQGGLSN